MIHPHVSTLVPVPTAPTCRDGQGHRCTAPATTWIVAPDHHVISAMCDRHAGAVLGEYAAKAGDVPELAGWYGAPVEVQPVTPIGTRVLIDCDGGAVPCEVIDRNDVRGMARLRMVLPGQKRGGLCFWRPDPSPSVADPIQLTGREDGDSPARGNGSATEGVGYGHPRSACLCVGVSRAGVPVAGARPVAAGAAL